MESTMESMFSIIRNKTWKGIYSLLVISIFISCERDNSKPGYTFFPDMEDSRAYEPYGINEFYKDSMAMRLPVEGTIPRGMIPFQYENTEAGLKAAGNEMVNPFGAYPDSVLDRGEVVYNRFCSHCHGINGDGKGILYTSGKYPLPPRDLTSDPVLKRPGGEIYHIITYGTGGMGGLASQIRPEDRWKIITYVNEVLQQEE